MKKSIVLPIVIAVSVAITGCITGSQYKTSTDIQAAVTIKNDPYTRSGHVVGPWVACQRLHLRCNALLRATKVKNSSEIIYQLYMSDSARDWRYFDRAFAIGGKKFKVTKILRKVDVKHGVMTREEVAIIFERKFLEESAQSGINLKVVGNQGEKVVYLESIYVQGFLSALEEAGY